MWKPILAVTVMSLLLLVIGTASAATYPIPASGNDLVGQIFTIKVKKGDTVTQIAKRYGLSIHELIEANPDVDTYQLHVGQKLVIPAQFILPKYRKGIVINLAELRLYYFTPDGKYVKTYPVGLGKREWRTPTVATSIIEKKVNPDWHVPKSIKEYTLETRGKMLPDVIEGGSSENPLGFRAMYLGKRGYLIHGTNNPHSIGKFVSSGCIRMNNEDVEALYPHVSVGTPVHIVNHSQKAGWLNGTLYLESHIPVNLPEQNISNLNNDSVDKAIRYALHKQAANINWMEADLVAEERTGVPHPIGSIR